MRLTYVRQKHTKGCGVACIAMVTGEPYDEVESRFEQHFEHGGMTVEVLRKYVCGRGFSAVESVGYGMARAEAQNARLARPFADAHVLRVVPAADSEIGHFVVMDRRGRVFDPADPGCKDPGGYYLITHAVGFFDERRGR